MSRLFTRAALTHLNKFIRERESIRIKKEAGEPWPWTRDTVLLSYRFCNIRRNDDRETRYIHQNWLTPNEGHPDLWFAMVVARIVNWWPSLEAVGLPLPWKPTVFTNAMDRRKDFGLKVFTGAYMIHADAHAEGTKAQYLAERVLTPMWKARETTRPREGDTLDAFHKRLMTFRDMGSFMAGQVVADIKYDTQGPLADAPDWQTWATSGPGSMRGLNRVMNADIKRPWTEAEWRYTFSVLYEEMQPYLDGLDLTGQDLQNCLCEYDKYCRGSSRSKYHPKKEQS